MPSSPNPSRRVALGRCGLSILALLSTAPVLAGDPVNEDWMPLSVGRSWVYVDEIGEELTIRVAGRAEEAEVGADRDCYHVTWNDDLLGPAYQAEIWCRDGADVVLAGKELSGSRLPMGGAAVLLRQPLEPGREWDSTFTLGEEELAARGVVVGRETVETPAGSFDTMHVRIEQPSGDVDRWYARGVGIVQEHTSLFGRSLGRKRLAEHIGTRAPETVALFDAPAEPIQPRAQARVAPQAEPQPPLEPESSTPEEGITSNDLSDDSEPLFPDQGDGDLTRLDTAQGDDEANFRGGSRVSSHPEFETARVEGAAEPQPVHRTAEPQIIDSPIGDAQISDAYVRDAALTDPEPEPSEAREESSTAAGESEETEPARTDEPESEWIDEDGAAAEPEPSAVVAARAPTATPTPTGVESTASPPQEAPADDEPPCELSGTYVVMVGGEVVETPEGWERDGRRVLYRNESGALLALRASSIDFEETERRQREACAEQAERERVKPDPPPRNWLEAAQRRPEDSAVMELADTDLAPGARRTGSATAEYLLRQLGVDPAVLASLGDSSELATLATVLQQQQSDLQARLLPYRERLDEGADMANAVADEVLATAKQLSQLAEREERAGLRDVYRQIGSELERSAGLMRSDPFEATRLLAVLSG